MSNLDGETARWLLDRQLHWISQAEVKVAAQLTINLAMLGGLAAAYAAQPQRTQWAILMSVLCGIGLVAAVACAAMCLIPRTDAPHRSGIFFGQIASRTAADFQKELKQMSLESMQDDIYLQVHVNAGIAAAKHRWVRLGVLWSFASAPFWLVSIAQLVRP